MINKDINDNNNNNSNNDNNYSNNKNNSNNKKKKMKYISGIIIRLKFSWCNMKLEDLLYLKYEPRTFIHMYRVSLKQVSSMFEKTYYRDIQNKWMAVIIIYKVVILVCLFVCWSDYNT